MPCGFFSFVFWVEFELGVSNAATLSHDRAAVPQDSCITLLGATTGYVVVARTAFTLQHHRMSRQL